MTKIAQKKNELKTKKMEAPFFSKKKPVKEQTIEEYAETTAKREEAAANRADHRAMVRGDSLILVEGQNDTAIKEIRGMLEFLASQEPLDISHYVEKYKVKSPSALSDSQKKRIANERSFYLFVRKFAESILKSPSQPTELRSNEVEDLVGAAKKQASLSSRLGSLADELKEFQKKEEHKKRDTSTKTLDDYSDEELESLNKQLNQVEEKNKQTYFGWERVFKYKGDIHRAYKLSRSQLELIEKLYYKMKEVSLKRQDVDYKKEEWEKAPKKETPKSNWLVELEKHKKEKDEKPKQESQSKPSQDLDFNVDEDKKTAKFLNKIKVAQQMSKEEALHEMRAWVAECEWGDLDSSEIEELSDEEVLRGVDKHYAGGVKGFLSDLGDSEEEISKIAKALKKIKTAENESHVPLLQVRSLIGVATDLEKLIDPNADLEDWVGSKIARALSDITDLKNYLEYHTVENKYNTPNTFDIGPVSLDSIASRVNRIKSIIKK